jgi:hypothetical protein
MELKNIQIILIERPEAKRLLGRLLHKWGNAIKTDLEKVEYDAEWINLA